MKTFVATVKLIVESDSREHAIEAIKGILNPPHEVLDWGFTVGGDCDGRETPREVELPVGYIEMKTQCEDDERAKLMPNSSEAIMAEHRYDQYEQEFDRL